MERDVGLFNVDAKGACGYLAYALGKLQDLEELHIPVAQRDPWGKEDLLPGQVLNPSSSWRVFESYVRDAISAMASQLLRTAPHGREVEVAQE